MKKCIGIISYLPDEQSLREYRTKMLINLVEQCKSLFDLPIIIVAQNWKDLKIDNCQTYYYQEKLGITGARRELRRIFLESEFDYLIMLDDDLVLTGNKSGAINYVSQIDSHPNMFGVFKDRSLLLFAISKEVFNLIDYPELEAENGEIFEDIYLVLALTKLYPNKRFNFFRTNDLDQISEAANDKYSTWWRHQFDKHKIGDNTRALVGRL